MNVVDVYITEILEEPKQVVNEEECCWQVKVMTDCYGQKKEKVLKATSKKLIDRYKVGYSWTE